MASTPAQRALDQAQAVASMRQFYASLGMRAETLERTMRLAGASSKAATRSAKRRAQRRRVTSK